MTAILSTAYNHPIPLEKRRCIAIYDTPPLYIIQIHVCVLKTET